MSNVVVFPLEAADEARGLLESAGWDVSVSSAGDGAPEAFVAAVRGNEVLYRPDAARVAARPRRILLLHDGTPVSQPAVEAAGPVAPAAGAVVDVVHVPPPEPVDAPGSLPGLRMSDHGGEIWEQWRGEFSRRFCTFPHGVSWQLDVAVGPPV